MSSIQSVFPVVNCGLLGQPSGHSSRQPSGDPCQSSHRTPPGCVPAPHRVSAGRVPSGRTPSYRVPAGRTPAGPIEPDAFPQSFPYPSLRRSDPGPTLFPGHAHSYRGVRMNEIEELQFHGLVPYQLATDQPDLLC